MKKATRLDLLSFKTPQMRAFHITWMAFFICFFGWFGIAPLMAVIRDELALTKSQVGNTIIASVAITIIARLLIGWLCDKYGPRITYTGLLLISSLPVMFVGLANSYETFLLFRLGIGVVGASFVITQYHTTAMFAPNVVGTANATSAGWGNLGGGVTQIIMPLVFAAIVGFGFSESVAWRYAMVLPGILMILIAIVYYFFTQDTPEGNFKDIKREAQSKSGNTFIEAMKDPRVWALFVIYGACFGVELTINNIAAIYFTDNFHLDVKTAGLIAGIHGSLNIFARSLGGIYGDKAGIKFGLKGRVRFLFLMVLLEGIFLMFFSQMTALPVAIIMLIAFSFFVQVSSGATFAVAPFVNKKAIGSVAGIVGAGGNAGAVAAGFLFKSESISYNDAFLVLGVIVTVASFSALLVRFDSQSEKDAKLEMDKLVKLGAKPAFA
jgi:NNP family nitrate/nitrite transporter-like MFS transporter